MENDPLAPKPPTEPISSPDQPTNQPVAQPGPSQPGQFQPPQPGQAVPFAPQYTRPLTPQPLPSEDPKKRKQKRIIILSSIGASIVLLGVLAAIFIPMLLHIDYKASYDQANNLGPELNHLYYTSNCRNVATKYNSTLSTSAQIYEGYIDNCRSEATVVYDIVDKLGATTGVANNSDNAELYDKFKQLFDTNTPSRNNLESTLDLYRGVHDFYLALERVNTDASASNRMTSIDDFSKITNYLVVSGNETLRTFANGLTERYHTLYDATVRRDNAANGNDIPAFNQAREAFEAAVKDYNDYLTKDFPDLSETAKLVNPGPNNDSIFTRFNALLNSITDDYTGQTGE